MIWVLVVCGLVIAARLWLRRRHSYWKDRGVPYLEPHFLFGNMADFYCLRATEAEALDSIYKALGHHPFFGVFYFWKPVLVLADPRLINEVTSSRFESFKNHPEIFPMVSTDRVGNSLFLMRDSEWKTRRILFTRMFSPMRLKALFPSVRHHCSQILPLIDKSAEEGVDIELEALTQRYTVNVITSSLFGLETDSIENANSQLAEHGNLIARPPLRTVLVLLVYTSKPWLGGKPVLPWLANTLGLRALPARVWNFFHEFTKQVVKERQDGGINRDDLLGLMIKTMQQGTEEQPRMTIEEMTSHVFAFFEAGYDTSTLTTSYCLYELSLQPDLQQRLRDELEAISGDPAALQELPLADHVIAEVLRKYPPAGVLKREASKGAKVGDVSLEEGQEVVLPVASLHHDPRYFPEPHLFKPERMASFDPNSASAYMPFGKGPRICIGKKLAELEVKIALSVLLERYEFLPSGKNEFPIKFDTKVIFITARPSQGLWVKVRRRN